MKQLVTTAIVLSRTNYGEADRIIMVVTPDYGKLRLMAKGVRRIKSKLAGGIELFSVSDITYIQGRSEICTLVSTRLQVHYPQIMTDINRVQLGYELIKLLNKATEDEVEADYFHLLHAAFEALNDVTIPDVLIRLWFSAQLLTLSGHSPNLKTDTAGLALQSSERYTFDLNDMTASPNANGNFGASHIKLLRLLFGGMVPRVIVHVTGYSEVLPECASLVQAMLQTHGRV